MLGLCVALGIGLLVGADRERRQSSRPRRGAAGIRTFAVAALLGSVAVLLGGTWVLAATALLVGAGTLLAYHLTAGEDAGLTSEFALLLTCLLGALAMHQAMLAAGVGAVLALLLAARERMHYFVSSVLRAQELSDLILFAALALIVLPLAPDQFMGPFDALNPRAMARLIVVVMAISALGYVAMRGLGPRYGLPLAGLAAGFVSSTATIYAMGQRVSAQPGLMRAGVAAAALSSVATFIQMAVVISLIQTSLLRDLALPLALGALVACLYGLVFTLGKDPIASNDAQAQDLGRAFNLKTAAAFAALVSGVVLISSGLNAWLGPRAMLLGAALTGLADTHSTAASAASLMAANKLSAAQAMQAILTGLSSNTWMKAVLAFKSGGVHYAMRVVTGLALMMAAVGLGVWLSP